MKTGDELLLRGPAGAPFRVTVGPAFTEQDIKQRLASGEWRQLDDEQPSAAPEPNRPEPVTPAAAPEPTKVDANRPPVNAPKAAWIDYVVQRRLMSRDDATTYTKADLIELAS